MVERVQKSLLRPPYFEISLLDRSTRSANSVKAETKHRLENLPLAPADYHWRLVLARDRVYICFSFEMLGAALPFFSIPPFLFSFHSKLD